MSEHDLILSVLAGRRGERRPCFTGLSAVTVAGLAGTGLQFHEIHADPERMALAAATALRRYGWPSVTVPFDLAVEAEALGAQVDFHGDVPYPVFPSVIQTLAENPEDLRLEPPAGLTGLGRIPVVLEALGLLRQRAGAEAAVGAWVPGPYTLALQVVSMVEMITAVARDPQSVARVLDVLTEVVAQTARAYRAAGADFITVHEMGGSPAFIGPRGFEALVQPCLQRLFAALPPPRVLSVCGNTNRAMPALAACGADAISVDQTNDLARSRATLGPDALLFGNIDPVGVLVEGDEAAVRAAVRAALDAGADAVWPGCDLAPAAPLANLQAMVDEARRYE